MSDDSMDQFGPVDYLIIEFPAGQATFNGEMAAELTALVDAGVIRVLDLVIIAKDEDGSIETVEGVDAVEAMPEFVRWAVKPEPHDDLWTTCDLRSAPYIAEFACPGDRREAVALIERVRGLVTWRRAAGPVASASRRVAEVREKVERNVAWVLHRAMQRARSGS